MFKLAKQTHINMRVIRPMISYHVDQRGMAVRTFNSPHNKPSVQGLKNNPWFSSKNNKSLFRHTECHRQECDATTDCKNQVCNSLCGNPTTRKAVAHATHGQSLTTEVDKTTYKVSSTDLNGQNKPQNLVVYDNAHDTPLTSSHVPGNVKLQQEPSITQLLNIVEDKT